jgi:membrane dipeptidase
MLNFGRDYTRAAADTRRSEREAGSQAAEHTGETLLGWPDYMSGRVAVVFGTLFVTPMRRREGEWDKQAYADFNQAHRLYWGQLDTYHRLAGEQPDKFRLVGTRLELESVLAQWVEMPGLDAPGGEAKAIGIIPLMEGAEGIRQPAELEEWWEAGLRTIGLAWAGTRFCGGTRDPGPLTLEGRELLEAMADIGFTLDISHMDPLSARQAIDMYAGPIIASHANAAALLPGYDGNRLLPDDVIHKLIERGGIIGVVPFCKFLDAYWKKGDLRDRITLETLAAQVDHICQMAGDAHHAGLGTDFDGGFGAESVPVGVDTIADMQKLAPILKMKGYNDEDASAVLGENWLRHLKTTLPK